MSHASKETNGYPRGRGDLNVQINRYGGGASNRDQNTENADIINAIQSLQNSTDESLMPDELTKLSVDKPIGAFQQKTPHVPPINPQAWNKTPVNDSNRIVEVHSGETSPKTSSRAANQKIFLMGGEVPSMASPRG